MTAKQQLIQAFKTLDFEALRNLLDDNRSYMDVSKELFLSRLEQELKSEIKDGLKEYENVVEGVCGTCNKGCKAYSFTKQNYASLNLFFEEKHDTITDIYLCGNLKTENPEEEIMSIYFSFYEEEKVDFKADFRYLNNLQKIQKATEEFNLMVMDSIPQIEELVYWHNKYKLIARELDLGDPFISKEYKAYQNIDRIYFKIHSLVGFYDKKRYSQEALKEYRNIDANQEKEVVYWLLTHKNSGLYNTSTKTRNWKKTGFIGLNIDPQSRIVVDCSKCLDAFLFADLYDTLEKELMEKYKPTEEHFIQNGGSVTYSLENYLRLHEKYLDLL